MTVRLIALRFWRLRIPLPAVGIELSFRMGE